MEIKTLSSLGALDPNSWNALLKEDFPFYRYEFLRAMETGGCVGPEAGWIPRYLCAYEGKKLVGALLLYEKFNSEGEFIFDWDWAMAYARAGLKYYPKIIAALPFTPVTAAKFLFHPSADTVALKSALVDRALDLHESLHSSGLHFLFIQPEEIPFFREKGFLLRHSFQLFWKNQGYSCFEDFLATLKRKARQDIQRERRQLNGTGLSIQTFTGGGLKPEHAGTMYEFYSATYYKKGSDPYLTREFFREVFARMKEKIFLVLAADEGKWVGGSISFIGEKRLYGRYWGCFQEYRHLHFELCYYQTIEYAIQQGLEVVEAGAGGGHKMPRGFIPSWTYSAHHIQHPQFREAIARFLTQEKLALEEVLKESLRRSPYK